MKTRPHIVTQTCLYDTAGLQRNADLLAARIGTAARLKDVFGYSRQLRCNYGGNYGDSYRN